MQTFCLGVTQQQSEQTCRALDTMVAGSSNSVLGDCVSNTLCINITCALGVQRTSLALLPCTNPVAVHFVTTLGFGSNSLLTQSAEFNLGSNTIVNIALTQTDDGILLGVSNDV